MVGYKIFGKNLNCDFCEFSHRTLSDETVYLDMYELKRWVRGTRFLSTNMWLLHDIFFLMCIGLSACVKQFVFMFTDEQERVQKKTFVNWINSYLSKVRSLRKKLY